MKLTLKLPLSRETKGALMYSLPDRAGLPFSNIYVRKDAVRRPGQTGWPEEITVTVEVPEQ